MPQDNGFMTINVELYIGSYGVYSMIGPRGIG